jgi:hypothetical protein
MSNKLTKKEFVDFYKRLRSAMAEEVGININSFLEEIFNSNKIKIISFFSWEYCDKVHPRGVEVEFLDGIDDQKYYYIQEAIYDSIDYNADELCNFIHHHDAFKRLCKKNENIKKELEDLRKFDLLISPIADMAKYFYSINRVWEYVRDFI